jgi:low affinity Fe/Cu permease
MPNTNSWFAQIAQKAAKVTGSSPAFVAVCVVTAAWLVSGPFFHWSDAWQLVINTLSNIVAMLMLFLIQNTQNRETSALQLKVDKLLRVVRRAENAFINLEELTEEDLTRIKERYARWLKRPARNLTFTGCPVRLPMRDRNEPRKPSSRRFR